MKFIKNYYYYSDERGSLYGIIQNEVWKEINYIESVKDSVRGNHYHKETLELFFIIDGEINIEIKNLNTNIIEKYRVKKGDIFIIEPYELHTFYCLTDSVWINMLSKPIEKDNPDIHRL